MRTEEWLFYGFSGFSYDFSAEQVPVPASVGSSKTLKDLDRLRVGISLGGVEDAQGTPTQSHISPSILVYEDGWTFGPLERSSRLGVAAKAATGPRRSLSLELSDTRVYEP